MQFSEALLLPAFVPIGNFLGSDFLSPDAVCAVSGREMAAQAGTKSQSRALPQRVRPVAGVVCLWSNFFLILCFRVNNILLGCWSGWIQKALCSGPCCLWPKEVIIHIMFRGTYTETRLRCHPVWFYWFLSQLFGFDRTLVTTKSLSSFIHVLCIYTFHDFLPLHNIRCKILLSVRNCAFWRKWHV